MVCVAKRVACFSFSPKFQRFLINFTKRSRFASNVFFSAFWCTVHTQSAEACVLKSFLKNSPRQTCGQYGGVDALVGLCSGSQIVASHKWDTATLKRKKRRFVPWVPMQMQARPFSHRELDARTGYTEKQVSRLELNKNRSIVSFVQEMHT